MQLSPSQIKNLMRRGLRLLLDPDLESEERRRVIEFFGHRCAYCGCLIEDGKGDLDHLLPTSRGGSNHVSNRVLSCKLCNAEEKRETDWQEFLHRKCKGETQTVTDRKNRIEQWIRTCGNARVLPETILRVLEEQCRRVTTEYDIACRKVREVRYRQ